MQVYKITHKVTGMSYIGVTKDLGGRIRSHRKMAAHGFDSLLSVAIRRDGWEAFEVSTVAFCSSRDDAHEKERAAILLFGTMFPKGYNRSPGGPGQQGCEVSAETRAKISAANRGKPFTYTPEWYAKICAKAKERRGSANIRARAVTFAGVTYLSISDAMAATGLTRTQFNYRLKLGLAAYTGVPKLTLPPGMGKWNLGKLHAGGSRPNAQGAKSWRARQVEVGGVIYPSLTAAVNATGLSLGELRGQLKRGDAKYLSASRFVQ